MADSSEIKYEKRRSLVEKYYPDDSDTTPSFWKVKAGQTRELFGPLVHASFADGRGEQEIKVITICGSFKAH